MCIRDRYNISKVRSYGSEINYNKRFDFRSWSLEIDVAYNYTISENQNDIILPKINAGDQLFYIPRHQSSTGLQCQFKKIKFNINGQYTGSTVGIIEALGSYTLINSSIDYAFKIRGQQINISAVLSNITNTNYRIIERRPMMGRNFNLHINYKL